VSTGPVNAPALIELCRLLERPDALIFPDALWLTGQLPLYQHLRDLGAVGLAQQVAPFVTCWGCASHLVRPERAEDGTAPYQGYCPECGRLALTMEDVRPWQAEPVRIAEWLSRALGLNVRHPVTPLLDGVLWHLGEREYRRYRYSFFFGCRLQAVPEAVLAAVARRAAPGAGVVITTTDPGLLPTPSPCRWVPLPAVAHLRKAGFALENFEAYLDDPPPPDDSQETSLRFLESHRSVLIDGESIEVPRQVARFLKVLLEADGDEVDKETIAAELNIKPTFKPADIFKRHRRVLDTFVQFDRKGRYWLRLEFLRPGLG